MSGEDERPARVKAAAEPSLSSRLAFDADQPLSWGLLTIVIAGLGVGLAAAFLAGFENRFLLVVGSTLVTLLIGSAASGSIRIAAIGGVSFAVLQLASVEVSALPVLAALLMAGVTFLGSLAAAPPRPSGLGDLVSLMYLIVAVFAPFAGQTEGLGAVEGLLVAVVGVAGGVLALFIMKSVRALLSRGAAPTPTEGPPEDAGSSTDAPEPPLLSTTRSALVYAGARAAIMGVLMAWFALGGPGRDIGWIMLTVTVVMKPGGGGTLAFSAMRSVGTLLGALVFAALSYVLSAAAIGAIALLGMVLGLAYSQRSYLVMVIGVTGAVVVLTGLPDQSYVTWAFARTIDTLIGAGLAVAGIGLVGVLGGPPEADGRLAA